MMTDETMNLSQSERSLPVDTVAERWGDAVASGFTAIPNTLIQAQVKLGLTPTDIVVLLNLLVHWWHRDRLPFPRTSVIAKRTGLSPRTVQRVLANLQKKKLLKIIRDADQQSRFDLNGLKTALSELAVRDPWNRPHKIRTPEELQEKEAGMSLQNS